MRKVIITCPCGQRMQVSRSAYGKVGLCPKCNQKLRVGATGLEPLALPSPGDAPLPPPPRAPLEFPERSDAAFENAKRNFATAVDYFYHAQYEKALGILDRLHDELPDNAQVQTARARCADAMNAARTEKTAAPRETPPDNPVPDTPTPQEETEPPPAQLTIESVHETVLRLMTSASPDSVRLKAAKLAARLLGIGRTTGSAGKPGVFFAHVAPTNGKPRPASQAPEERACLFK